MHILRALILVAILGGLVAAGVLFVRSNEAPVSVDLLLTQVPDTSLWLVLLVTFAAGAALAGLVGLFEVTRYGLVARRYRKTVARLESEIHQLRNLPLADEVPALGGESSGGPLAAVPPGGTSRGGG